MILTNEIIRKSDHKTFTFDNNRCSEINKDIIQMNR